MLRVMALMGADAYFQPLKNLLRWQLLGGAWDWQIPDQTARPVYIKETLGPYTLAESAFNPLDLLLQAGVPAEKIHLWVYGRAPLACYASWVKWWGDRTTVDYFCQSYITTQQAYEQAARHNIKTTVLTYEQFAEHTPVQVMRSLAARFRFPFHADMLNGWSKLPEFGTAASHITLPEEPDIFITPHIHDQVEEATHFYHHPPTAETLNQISADDHQQMSDLGVFAIYEKWHRQATVDLKLSQ